jgi:hypothetical protein
MGFEDQKFEPTLPNTETTDMGKKMDKEINKSLVKNQLPPTHFSIRFS